MHFKFFHGDFWVLLIFNHLNHAWITWEFCEMHFLNIWFTNQTIFVTFDSTMKYSCNINKWILHTSNNTINLEFFDIFQVFSSSFNLQSNRCIPNLCYFDQCFTSSHQMLIQLWIMSRLKWKFTITKMTDQEIRDNPVQFNLDLVVVCFIQNFYFFIFTTWYFHLILDNKHRLFSLKDSVKHKICSDFLTLTLNKNTAVFKFPWNANESWSNLCFYHDYASNKFILTFDEKLALNKFTLFFWNWP